MALAVWFCLPGWRSPCGVSSWGGGGLFLVGISLVGWCVWRWVSFRVCEGAKVCHPGCGCWVPHPGWLLCACAFLLWPVRWCMSWFAGCPSVGLLSGFVVDSGDTRIGVGWRFCGGCGSPRLVSSACQ